MNSIGDILNIISNFTFKTKDNKNIVNAKPVVPYR